jgi:hypothetical protein
LSFFVVSPSEAGLEAVIWIMETSVTKNVWENYRNEPKALLVWPFFRQFLAKIIILNFLEVKNAPTQLDKFGAFFPPSVDMSPNLVTLTETSTFSVSKKKKKSSGRVFLPPQASFFIPLLQGTICLLLRFFFVTGIHDLNWNIFSAALKQLLITKKIMMKIILD